MNLPLKSRRCSWICDRAGPARIAGVLAAALWSLPLVAAETGDAPPAPEDLAPEITIIRQGGETMQEYRLNGQLYMVKVTPSRGYPYYLVDMDGDGALETRRNSLEPEVTVPQWILFRWK